MAEYVRNVWYMAAWEEEIIGEAMLGRMLLDEPWLILRATDGSYAMMSDRCPHRLAPLHKGQRIGDSVACPYHGLAFDTAGACVRNPFSEVVPPHARLTVHPIVPRYGALWFWPGEAALADPDLIPDFSALDDPAPMVRGRTRFEANYEVITDNLMDLSHAEFIHVDTFRTEGKIFAGRHSAVETTDGAIWSNWAIPTPIVRLGSRGYQQAHGLTNGWRCVGTHPRQCCCISDSRWLEPRATTHPSPE